MAPFRGLDVPGQAARQTVLLYAAAFERGT
jgi:hypothetical protein